MMRRDVLDLVKVRKIAELGTELFQSWKRQERDKPPLDLLAVFRGDRSGLVRELLEDNSRRAGQMYDKDRPYIEFRDLIKGTASLGGNLVATDLQPVVDLLRPFSITVQLGAQIEEGLVGDQLIPKISAKHSPTWLANEAASGNVSTPTLQAITLTPKTVIVNGQMSRQFYKQANAPGFLELELANTLGTTLDQVVLGGASSANQPIGVVNTSGIQVMSGTALSGASANHMKMLAASANASDLLGSFVGTPSARLALENRERATGSGFVWQDDKVSGRPAYVSNDLPTVGNFIYGPWNSIYVGIWGRGFTLELNPYETTNFTKAIIQYRMMLSMDVAIRQAGAFILASPNVT